MDKNDTLMICPEHPGISVMIDRPACTALLALITPQDCAAAAAAQ